MSISGLDFINTLCRVKRVAIKTWQIIVIFESASYCYIFAVIHCHFIFLSFFFNLNDISPGNSHPSIQCDARSLTGDLPTTAPLTTDLWILKTLSYCIILPIWLFIFLSWSNICECLLNCKFWQALHVLRHQDALKTRTVIFERPIRTICSMRQYSTMHQFYIDMKRHHAVTESQINVLRVGGKAEAVW